MNQGRWVSVIVVVTGLISLGCSGIADQLGGGSPKADTSKLRVAATKEKKGPRTKGPSATATGKDVHKHEYVVKLRPGVKELTTKKGSIGTSDRSLDGAFSSLSIAGAAKVHLAKPKNSALSDYLGLERTIRFTSKKPKKEVLARLEAHEDVEWVESVIKIRAASAPNDPYWKYQWHMKNLKIPQAWQVTKGKGVVVAVVDTGVSVGEDGYFKMLPGYDFVQDDNKPADGNGHGTHVAGTIGQAANNGIGVAGVAPEVTILPVRVLDDYGSGSNTWVAGGIVWAVDHGANIINLSLGSAMSSETVADACAYAYEQGVTVIAATGNDGFTDFIGYPAAYETTIAVGSVDPANKVAYYSNQGAQIDLVAPGGDTTVDDDGDGMPDGVVQETVVAGEWSYMFFQGTSMATPHVAGVAALVYANGVTKPDRIRKVLRNTARDLGGKGWDSVYGAGVVDPVAALQGSAPAAAAKPKGLTVVGSQVKRTSGNRAVIGWLTSEPSDTKIRGSNGFKEIDDTLVTAHRVTVDGKPGQTVSYEIKSTAKNGKSVNHKVDVKF